jgi:class 3 adenylate cyclase/tetratricopeptide (TPR) repeat protein
MVCASCGTENREGRRFCLSCGSPLGAACPNCGAENEPEARFCGSCGQGLAAGRQGDDRVAPPVAGQPWANAAAGGIGSAERRLVTVLFADLVGFTPFAEERDAEEVRETLQRYSELARETVSRYGGTIEKFIGDAVMAVWGTPTAHEDDAERAVRAALELTDSVRTLGSGIEARAGVLTGEAAVNLGATDQGFLAGDLVNTAARLQSVASAGSVLVGEATMRAASAAVAFEPTGEQELKGKAVPVPAWRAVRVVAQRRGAGRTEALETPFVGRDEEFRVLRDHLHLTGRDPRVRLVSVTGPAGIGKSRLAWELEKYVDGVVETVYWHRGRCPAYGDGVSFWALGEMVRSRAGLVEGDDEPTTRQRLRATVEQYVGAESERDWIEQALLVLLGVEQQTSAGRETLFAAWRRFFESIAALGTTVLVFEDLHWADDGLLDFIDHLLDWSKTAPLLVVTLARPELFDRRADWGAGRRTFSALALNPLADSAMREMLSVLVPDLPSSALDAIVQRADGIPLYAVETVRMLAADGRLVEVDGRYRPSGELGDLQVPDSLRSLITARLDGLDADDRRLLQEASVLGQTFTAPALAAVSGAAPADLEQRLRGLVRRELLTVEADPRSPERGQYGFMQGLIKEVAYSTLARPERRQRHLAAARHFEATGGDEMAGILAGHYIAAHDASSPGPEADAVAAQARIALIAAADRASALGGHKQAASYLQQAITVSPEALPRAQLLVRRSEELDIAAAYEEALDGAKAAIEIFREAGDTTGLARAHGAVGTVLVHMTRIKEAVASLETALTEVPADADPQARAEVLAKLSRALYRNLEPVRAIEFADQALVLAEHHRMQRIVAEAMVSKGTALVFVGRPLEALALLHGGRDLARRVGDVPTELRALANLSGPVAGEQGSAAALAIVREGLALSRAVGDIGQTVWHMGSLLTGAAYAPEPIEPSLQEADAVLALDLASSDRTHLLGGYSIASAMAGRPTDELIAELLSEGIHDPQTAADYPFIRFFPALAAGDYGRALAFAEETSVHRPELGMLSVAALVAAVMGNASEVGRLLELVDRTAVSSRVEAATRTAARGMLMTLEGRAAEVMPMLRDVLRELRELGDALDFGVLALAMLNGLGPTSPEARAAGEEALANYEKQGARPMIEQLRAALGREPSAAGEAGGAAAETRARGRTAEEATA